MHRDAQILVVSFDGGGNLPPERSLIRELVERGHTLHVLGHDSLREKVVQDGALFVGLRSAPQYDLTAKIHPDREFRLTLENVILARGFAADVSLAIDRLRPDLLLVDAGLAYGLVGALHSGLPTVAMWHSIYSLVAGGPFAAVFDSRLSEINEFASRMTLGPFSSHQRLLESAPLILVFSYRYFDPLEELASHVVHVGPLRSPREPVSRWPRRYPERPLVLVGLSTTYQDQTALLQRLCEAFAELEVEAVVTTGPAISPNSLNAPSNTSVLDFVPHDAVLPETDLLVTHAGHGTVMAGIAHGVPMLCFPMGRDQPFVANRVAELGLGMSMSPTASAAGIRDAIAGALVDTQLKRNSAQFVKTIAGHPGLEQAVSAIEALL